MRGLRHAGQRHVLNNPVVIEVQPVALHGLGLSVDLGDGVNALNTRTRLDAPTPIGMDGTSPTPLDEGNPGIYWNFAGLTDNTNLVTPRWQS